MEIQIVLPAVSDDAISDMLRCITRAIEQKDSGQVAHGFLGGSDGYGGHWSSDVFDMRPFYWGDCDCGYDEREEAWSSTNSHSEECYQTELRRRKLAAGCIVHPGDWLAWPQDWDYDRTQAAEGRIYDELCAKHSRDRKFGAAVHCTCQHGEDWKAWSSENGHTDQCALQLPNFRHHVSGLEVRWYKYIGRSMEVIGAPVDLTPVLSDCLACIAAQGIPLREDSEAG